MHTSSLAPDGARVQEANPSQTPSRSNRNARPAGIASRPLQVTWEMTQACDWKTTHVRRGSRSLQKQELSTAEAFHLIDSIASMRVPLLVLTGGDPLLRYDLFPIIESASSRSVRTSLTLLPTPRLERDIIADLKASGLMRVAFWLHGSTAALDDAHWPVRGGHRKTLEIIGACHEVDLPVQINTILAARNFHDVDPMIELLTHLDVVLWNVIFLVPGSREQAAGLLTADEHEQIFSKLHAASRTVHFQIKTTGRRTISAMFLSSGLERRAGESPKPMSWLPRPEG